VVTDKPDAQPLKHILILCVDRDDDLGIKAGVSTPIIGRDANVEAAVMLALKDPEEPDANAIFEAVRLYDTLQNGKKLDETFEVATIAGSKAGGVSADRKIVDELKALTNVYHADEVILVTDGYSDEAVLPLIESRVPVSSVRRIVIKHSESIEESVALMSRYLKMLTENPRYARLALGLPGLLLVIWAILVVMGVVSYYFVAIILIAGAVLLFKGFGVDKAAGKLYRMIKEYSPPPLHVQISNYASIAGVLCIIVGVYAGVANAAAHFAAAPSSAAAWLSALPVAVGYFIHGAADLVVVGVVTALFGRAVRWYFERDVRVLRNAAVIVSIVWSRWILDGTADVLIRPEMGYDKLMFSIVVGILIGIASILVIYIIQRSYSSFFKKTDEAIQEFEKPKPDA